MTPPSTHIREILVCEAHDEDSKTLLYVLVLRKGLQFELLDVLGSEHCALLPDSRTLKLLEREFELPVRVLDGPESAFLGAKTLLARKTGAKNYRLRVRKPDFRMVSSSSS